MQEIMMIIGVFILMADYRAGLLYVLAIGVINILYVLKRIEDKIDKI